MVDPVAVIIPTMNRLEMLSQSLASLMKLQYDDYEIIVVDNGSVDDTAVMVETDYPGIHLLEQRENQGVAGGRNIGLRYAFEHLRSSLFLFIDDDATVEPETLGRLCDVMRDDSVGLVTPKRYLSDHPGLLGSAGGHEINLYTGSIRDLGVGELDVGQYDSARDVQSAGGIVLIRKTVFDRIGLYDESFNPYGWEDVDLALRARAQGFRIRYEPQAIVYHAGGKLGRGTSIPAYEQSKTKNYFTLLRRHARLRHWYVLVVALPVRGIAAVMSQLLSGNWAAGLAIVRGVLRSFGAALRFDR